MNTQITHKAAGKRIIDNKSRGGHDVRDVLVVRVATATSIKQKFHKSFSKECGNPFENFGSLLYPSRHSLRNSVHQQKQIVVISVQTLLLISTRLTRKDSRRRLAVRSQPLRPTTSLLPDARRDSAVVNLSPAVNLELVHRIASHFAV